MKSGHDKPLTRLARGPARLAAIMLVAYWTMVPSGTFAQSKGDAVGGTPQTQRKVASEAELEAIRANLKAARERREALAKEIEALENDREAINRALITTAKRSQEIEENIGETETRLSRLKQQQDGIQSSLNDKRGLLMEVLSALQRMGRNPPPAVLVRPRDALSSVRSAILLGAVVPEVRVETEALLKELKALAVIQQDIRGQRDTLRASLNALEEDETRLSLLVEQKAKLAEKSRKELREEQRRAEDFAAKAKNLKGLISTLEKEIASAAAAAKSAREADERRQTEETKRLAKAREQIEKQRGDKKTASLTGGVFANAGRIEPAISFRKARGLLPRPVNGVEVRSFGDETSLGNESRNVGIATRANARVRSPADGWVVYAGPFRSYGQLLILNAGDDYHVVLAGMERVNVSTGQFVLTGEPVGTMGTTRVASAVGTELGATRPVLYVEFRKNGKPVDPSPWWAATASKGLKNDS